MLWEVTWLALPFTLSIADPEFQSSKGANAEHELYFASNEKKIHFNSKNFYLC